MRLKLQRKPFQILEFLLQHPGELVPREQLAQRLWPDLRVSFDRSLNTAMNALRRALGDAPHNPRFIETRTGLGYRFMAPLEELAETPPGPTYARNFEAYQNYLKGKYFYNKRTEEDLRKSIAYFEAALTDDPRCALAYAGLADTYSLFAFLGTVAAKEAHARVKKFTTAALRIDPQLAEAHTSLAGVKKLYEWDWAGAEAEYLRALELNPRYAAARQLYADHLSAMGRPQEAIQQIRSAQELEPLSLVISMEMAWILYMARDFQGAFEQSWKTLALEPRFAAAQNTLGLAYEQMGMHDEAIVEFQNARVCSDGHPAAIAALAHAYASAGKRQEAAEMLSELQHVSRHRYVSPYWLSIVYAGVNEHDRAFESLEKACDERDIWLVWLRAEPRFDCLRSHARFDDLLRRIGLCSVPRHRTICA
jgi:tetratricopeptide (TPR) repeat protein